MVLKQLMKKPYMTTPLIVMINILSTEVITMAWVIID